MKKTFAPIAATLLMLMSSGAIAAELRPGQAGMDQMRRQLLEQLHRDMLTLLQPRLHEDIVAANLQAAPQHLVAGMSRAVAGRGNAAP